MSMTDEEFFEARRKLAEKMIASARERGEEIIEVEGRFTNDDVPRFLEKLDRFEEASRKSKIIVNYHEPAYTA